MKTQLLLVAMVLGLAACKKEAAAPGPAQYTFKRTLHLSPSGVQLDTTYATNGLATEAEVAQAPFQGPVSLYVVVGTQVSKDNLTIHVPLSKLNPGWVGTYSFVGISVYNASTGTYSSPGDVYGNYLFLYNPGIIGFGLPFNGPCAFTISSYDAGRSLVSGSYSIHCTTYLGVTSLATGPQACTLELDGTFTNLKVTQ